jgi:hypothetical protein
VLKHLAAALTMLRLCGNHVKTGGDPMNSTIVWLGVGGIIVSLIAVLYRVIEEERKKLTGERDERERY